MMEVAESKHMSARVRTCVENSLRRDTAAHTLMARRRRIRFAAAEYYLALTASHQEQLR